MHNHNEKHTIYPYIVYHQTWMTNKLWVNYYNKTKLIHQDIVCNILSIFNQITQMTLVSNCHPFDFYYDFQ